MTMIEQVRKFLLTCEHLQSYGSYVVPNVTVDYLGADTVQYSIEPAPGSHILKSFIDGSKLRQFNFVFASIQPHGSDVLQNIENTGFYERFAKWLEEQTDAESLPAGWEVIESLTSGYLYAVQESKARYQMQCRVVYRTEN